MFRVLEFAIILGIIQVSVQSSIARKR